MSVIALSFTARDSALPMTSCTQITFIGMFSGADSALVAGLEPIKPMSALLEPKAWMTSPPESNLFQVILAFGMQVSNIFWSFTTRSPLGMFW